MIQKKLPLEKNEYYTCIGIALELGKTLDQAKRDWQRVNHINGIDMSIHLPWGCCEIYE